MSKAAEYPSVAPAIIPIADCLIRSNNDPVNENSPVPLATVSSVKVTIAPIASLNADLLTMVCATRSRMCTCRKIGTRVAGSVEAMVEPSRRATIQGRPSTKCAAVPVTAAVMHSPKVAISRMVIQTCLRTLNRTDAPPSKRM